MKLDLVDKRLLFELDNDCRQPLSKTAKKLRISRNVALYRLERLKKRGIIRGSFTEINLFALGLSSIRVLLKLGNYTKTQENELVEFIKSQKGVMWFFKVMGKYDLDLVIARKNIFEFVEFQTQLLNRFNSIIETKNIAVLTQIYHYPKDYLLDKPRVDVKRKVLNQKQIKLDEKDAEILKKLSNNAMINILDLAKQTGLSINTIKKRMKQLRKNNVILGYRLFTDTNLLGYNYYKLHLNFRNYLEKDLVRLRSFLESKNFVIYLDQYLGGEDLEIELHLKSDKEYLKFYSELIQNFGKTIKDHFLIKFYEELEYKYLPEY